MKITPAPSSFSLIRLISALSNPESRTDCPELRHSESVLEPMHGRAARGGGAFLPLPIMASGLDTKFGSPSNASYLTQHDIGADIVESLRAQSVLSRAGAQVFSGLEFGFSLVVQKSGVAAAWVPENPGSDVDEVDPVFESRNFSPHSLQGTVAVSRALLTQSNPNFEAYLRAEFGRAIAEAVDGAGLNGSGNSNQPTGVLNVAGINTNALGASGGSLTGADITELERLVGIANATPTAVIAAPALRKKLRDTARGDSGSLPIWTDSNSVLGYPAYSTTGMPTGLTKGSSTDCTPLIIGAFDNLVIALWSLELTLDPFTKKKSGMVEITLFTSCDIGVLRPACFAVAPDARP